MKRFSKILFSLAGVLFLMMTSAHASGPKVSFGDFLGVYFDHMGEDIPDTYKYITLFFQDIDMDSDLHEDLQKAVYLDMVQNKAIKFNPNTLMTQDAVAVFVRAHFGYDISYTPGTLLDQSFLDVIMAELPGYADYYCGEKPKPQPVNLGQFAITREAEFGVLDDVYKRLTTDYYGEALLGRDLVYGAAQGMAKVAQDPYTSFFIPQTNTDFQEEYNGSYEGIGAILELTDKGMVVVSPFEGSPAEKAGLKAGDLISHIDGTDIQGWTENDIIALVKGPAGTSVNLSIVRGAEKMEVSVIRKVIVINFVHHELLDKDNYYIDLDSFGARSATAFANASEKFKTSGASKLIIDVRNNPGGGVDEVHDMLSHFIEKGKPTLFIKTTSESFSYKSTGANPVDTEIVVLINPGSASASEILALSLQDYGLATIVGETSFGKGSVQTLLEYKQGAALKLTTHKRYSGLNSLTIDGVGVTPDLEVIPTQFQEENGVDVQLNKAVEL